MRIVQDICSISYANALFRGAREDDDSYDLGAYSCKDFHYKFDRYYSRSCLATYQHESMVLQIS